MSVVPGSELLFCRSQSLTPHPAVPRLETNYAEANGPVLISSATAGMPASARQFARQRGRAAPARDKTRNLLADRCIYRTTHTPCYRCNKAGRPGGRAAVWCRRRCCTVPLPRGGTRPSRQCRRPSDRPARLDNGSRIYDHEYQQCSCVADGKNTPCSSTSTDRTRIGATALWDPRDASPPTLVEITRTKWIWSPPTFATGCRFSLGTVGLCGGKLLVAVTRERRYGPSRLRRLWESDSASPDLLAKFNGEGKKSREGSG